MMAAAITRELKGEPATRMYSFAAVVSPGASVAGKRNSVFLNSGLEEKLSRPSLDKQGNTRRKQEAAEDGRRFAR
jgi:hypothetical protein